MSNLIGPRLPGSAPAPHTATEPKARPPATPAGHGAAPAAHTLQPRRGTSTPRPPDATLRQRPRVPAAQLHALRLPTPGPLALTVPVHGIEHAQAELALKNAVTEALAGKSLPMATAVRPAWREADVTHGIAAIRSPQDYARALGGLRTLPSAHRGPHLVALMRQSGYSGAAQDATFRGFLAELADLEPAHRGEALVELCGQFRNLVAADLLAPAATGADHQALVALAQDMPPALLREPVEALALAVGVVAPEERAPAQATVAALADTLAAADLLEVLARPAVAAHQASGSTDAGNRLSALNALRGPRRP